MKAAPYIFDWNHRKYIESYRKLYLKIIEFISKDKWCDLLGCHKLHAMNTRTTTDGKDRRRAPRYPVALPVEWENGTGMTCNVSTIGVLFKADEAFVVDIMIRFPLIVEHLDGAASYLCCEGKMVRVEPHGEQWGIAVEITSFWFESN